MRFPSVAVQTWASCLSTRLEPALLATIVARAEANALNLAHCGTLFALLWNFVMEHCVRLFDRDEAKHKRGDTVIDGDYLLRGDGGRS